MPKYLPVLERFIVLIIIGTVMWIGLSYYRDFAEQARLTEVLVLWRTLKSTACGQSFTWDRAERTENRINQKQPLHYYNFSLVCRQKDVQEICWEAELNLKVPHPRVQYYITTQHNFTTLVCVPINAAGKKFCRENAAQGDKPDTTIGNVPAYVIRY